MANLTAQQKKQLGSLIVPFERSNKTPEKKILKVGETEKNPFNLFIHDGANNKNPNNCVFLTSEVIENFIKIGGRYQEKCYLWIIDEYSIKIIREKTFNTLRTHNPQYVCHTNLTGGGKAYIGGEMFFGQDGNIYVNHFSDRYGNPSNALWQAALDYIKSVGYQNIIDILEILPSKN